MRALRLSLAGTVILALLGGLGGAVVAQSGEPAPATRFSGEVRSMDHVISATCADVDGVEECRNGWVEYVFEWSDPRMPRAGWVVVNRNRFDVSDTPDQARVAIGKAGLDGPDGAWVGSATGIWLPDEPSVVLWVLEGEGAYEGMTAFLRDSGSGISGFITESGLPPMPEASEPLSTTAPDITPGWVRLLECEEYSGSIGAFADVDESSDAKQDACHRIAQLQNVARGMPVVAKDTIGGYPDIHAPEFLTDGKYGNSHSWVAESGNSWVKLDLLEPTAFDLVRFGRDRLEGGHSDRDPGHFTIEIADVDSGFAAGSDDDDADEYQVIFDSTDSSFDGDLSARESVVVLLPEPVEAQFVKLNLTAPGAAVDELELLEIPDIESAASSDD